MIASGAAQSRLPSISADFPESVRGTLQAVRSTLAIVAVLVGACGSGLPGDDEPDAVDVRIPIPAPDPAYLDLVTPEQIVQPGQEAMYCLHVENEHEVAVDDMLGLYGPGGHHIALYTTTDPKPPGTIEECTSPESNAPLQWMVITAALAPGQAIHLPAGFRYVLQYHYINAGEQPIRVRDVARLHKVEPAEVTMWVGSVVAQSFAIDIPPGDEHTLVWDCVLPTDRDLLFMFGHMHEWGKHYKIEAGPTGDALRTLWDMDWKPEWRDGAPSLEYQHRPLRLPAGTIIRSTCTHHNTTSAPLTFPVEMCMTFSYMGGSKETLQCFPP